MYDFQEMLSEMLGELNGSHTGARYQYRSGFNMGTLGAFYDEDYKGDGLKIKEIIKGESVTIDGDGGQTRDFVHIENVVQANLRAALYGEKAKGMVFNVAYGDTVTLLEFYNELNRLLGKDVKPNFGPVRPGDIRHSSADTKKIREVLGYAPEVSFLDGLAKTIEWYKNNL